MEYVFPFIMRFIVKSIVLSNYDGQFSDVHSFRGISEMNE